MIVYLAGVGGYAKHLVGLPNLRFLVSYFYLRNQKSTDWQSVNFAIDNNIPLMLDCGAWSAMSKREIIDNDKYIKFCKDHQNKFEVIVSLDVIGDWQKTEQNHNEMKQAGLNSLTTFHLGSPIEQLINLLESEDYIGIGGIAGKGSQITTQKWVKYINNLSDKCKFHGFGVTTPELLKIYNWHSVDGTTWMTGAARYGRIMYHTKGCIKWIKISDQKELEANWHLIGNDIQEGWDLKKGRTKAYEKVSLRYNAKSLIDLVDYCSKNKTLDMQEFLL